MPPKLPAASMAPEKNARFSGQVREVDLAELLPRLVARPLEGARDHVEVRVAVVAHHAVALEHALDERLHDLRVLLGEAVIDHQHVGDDEQVLVGDEHLRDAAALLDDLRDGGRPRHRARQPVLARLHVAQEELAGLRALLGVDDVEAIGARGRVEAAEQVDVEPGFLREIAQEEVGLGELRGRDDLALEVVDLLDLGADDEAVGAARVADLHRHHHVELPAVHRQHVHRRHRPGDLAGVQVRPALVLAERQLHLEAVVLEEDGALARLEAAVGGDEPGVAGVLADLDGDDVVLHREGRRRPTAAALRAGTRPRRVPRRSRRRPRRGGSRFRLRLRRHRRSDRSPGRRRARSARPRGRARSGARAESDERVPGPWSFRALHFLLPIS